MLYLFIKQKFKTLFNNYLKSFNFEKEFSHFP